MFGESSDCAASNSAQAGFGFRTAADRGLPTFRFAGTELSGFPVGVCESCGSPTREQISNKGHCGQRGRRAIQILRP